MTSPTQSATALPLRRLLNAAALFVAVVTAATIPLGYFWMGYSTTAQYLTFRTEFDASAVAQYVYTHERLWQYHSVRLQEVLERDRLSGEQIKSRILAAGDEHRPVAESGGSLDWPVATRGVPVVVSGRTVGQVQTEISIRPLLLRSAIVGLLGSLLGFAIYFAVRLFPLRVLDRAIGELETTNRRFGTALANMSQGLCMFDRDERLLVSNRRYAEMYGLDPNVVRPGMPLREVLELRIAAGTHYGHPYATTSATRVDGEVEPSDTEVELNDGRIFHVVRMPMENGGWVGTHEDVTERKIAQAKVEYLAHHDALTGLPNRLQFRRQLERSLDSLSREATLAVLCLDLDHFKAVNDTLGHPVGDVLLKELAQRLAACMRETEFLTRQGGDEFAVIMTDTTNPLTEAAALAGRLIEAVSEPFLIDDHHVAVGLSVGIAVAPGDSDDPDDLLKAADLALYRAKNDGRGTYRFFEPEMDARAQARRLLELDLRAAVGRGEFELYYQPIVAMRTEEIIAFEALVRWRHPTRGLLPPADFIPVAEETGLIVPLGEWILRQACADAAAWSVPVRVAVNLSAIQFRSHRLVQTVISAVTAAGLAPERLELEVTESVLLQDTATTLAALHSLRDFGANISMDDFGTGYSSLSYLRSFPFDKIKIDRSFVEDLADRPESMAIVRAVAGLGSSLGIETTAEGVETAEQIDLLRREGCTEMQGYIFSPPRPAAEVEQLLKGNREQARAIA
jgi:diguanylate cyclase (GGDEF)-like protein